MIKTNLKTLLYYCKLKKRNSSLLAIKNDIKSQIMIDNESHVWKIILISTLLMKNDIKSQIMVDNESCVWKIMLISTLLINSQSKYSNLI